MALHVYGKIELAEKESALGRFGLQPTDICAGHGDDTYLCHVPLPSKTLPLPPHVEAELRDDVIHLRKMKINPARRLYERLGFQRTYEDRHQVYMRLEPGG